MEPSVATAYTSHWLYMVQGHYYWDDIVDKPEADYRSPLKKYIESYIYILPHACHGPKLSGHFQGC